MKMGQNQTFFHKTYSILTPYFNYQKILKYFNDFQNRNFLVLAKVNTNNGSETRGDIFPGDTFKTDIIFYWSQNNKILQWLL